MQRGEDEESFEELRLRILVFDLVVVPNRRLGTAGEELSLVLITVVAVEDEEISSGSTEVGVDVEGEEVVRDLDVSSASFSVENRRPAHLYLLMCPMKKIAVYRRNFSYCRIRKHSMKALKHNLTSAKQWKERHDHARWTGIRLKFSPLQSMKP